MRLTKGSGSPATGGCWMVAVQRYTENEGWHDHPECVCPVIRGLCIEMNDRLPDGDRERIIGPHLFAPVGTRRDDLLQARLARVVRFAVEQADAALDQAGLRLPAAPSSMEWELVHHAARVARDIARASGFYVSAAAADDLCSVLFSASMVDFAAAHYVRAAHLAVRVALSRNGWEDRVLALILDLCAMSTPSEACPVRTREQVLREVCLVTP